MGNDTGNNTGNDSSFLSTDLVPDWLDDIDGSQALTWARAQSEATVAGVDSLADDTRDLVLLDEPTAHLDADSAPSVIRILRTRARRGATVIATSHDPLLIAAADDVVEVQSR